MRNTLIVIACLLLCVLLVSQLTPDASADHKGPSALAAIPHRAQTISLNAPLSSTHYASEAFDPAATAIRAIIHVPSEIPDDFGCGAFLADDDGNWLMQRHPHILKPGVQVLQFSLASTSAWNSTTTYNWNDYRRQLIKEFGLYFWSQDQWHKEIQIESIVLLTEQIPPIAKNNDLSIYHLQLQNMSSDARYAQATCGERWECRYQLSDLIKFPYQSNDIDCRLEIRNSEHSYQVLGFYREAQLLYDAGDHEGAIADQEPYFCHRFRPMQPGIYQLQLSIKQGQTHERVFSLPELHVSGEPWDDYVHVSTKDPRFFCVGDKDVFFYPVGINLRSVNDALSKKTLKTTLTAPRGSLAYEAYFKRLNRAGINAVEIWMSSWNLALEWIDDWHGYHGIKGYHAAHAEQLDRVLDAAYNNGIRVILSFRNHGQACTIGILQGNWHLNPMNSKNGGFIKDAKKYFTHEQALQLQEDYHRYLIARYADHPGILMWKLWSEVDLTAQAFPDYHRRRRGNKIITDWHAQMSAHLQSIDIYDHPVATHWSTDYKLADPDIIKLPSMDVGCLDAYHWDSMFKTSYLYNVLVNSMIHKSQGLNHLNKPIVVTEFGGSPLAANPKQLFAEHLSGPWIGMCSGHGMSPFLWWYEWVDQNNHWQPYKALQSFLVDEDLRGTQARTVSLNNNHDNKLWTRSWIKPGLALIYCLDKAWSHDGGAGTLHRQVSVTIGDDIQAGTFLVEWWDASQGHIISSEKLEHPGGMLQLQAPDFRKHLAAKCRRLAQ